MDCQIDELLVVLFNNFDLFEILTDCLSWQPDHYNNAWKEKLTVYKAVIKAV